MGTVGSVCLYIIKGKSGMFYCGITNSIIRRFQEHKKGFSKWGSLNGVEMVVYQEWFRNYKEAREREVYIKKRGVRRYLVRVGLRKEEIRQNVVYLVQSNMFVNR